ncbi:SDR family NAD(P)-dependent oxidoreductase [Propioniciclava flava]|uniref:Uncharacterized protein n=1 Tax=Propioniciclava flava TaxID=2072026 RepID=A0A4Q2EKQ5_9ACTN|nr:SDR family NAD(P)-dependent oxidoreductase [Propioniciclava flava]RXW33356.1 hypothetical protein C1706_00890 [Propioniciclava flava]
MTTDLSALSASRRMLRREGVFLSAVQASPAYGVVFPGHGSQYLDLLAGLRWSDPLVASVFDQADDIFESRYGHSLSSCVYTERGATPATLAEPTAMQGAIFTASLAQYRRLTSLFTPPDLLIGHSLGEYAAYVAGGILSFPDALDGVLARAETVSELPIQARGTMVAVRLRGDAERHIYQRLLVLAANAGDLCEAIANSSSQRVVSGSEEAIASFLQAATDARLPVTRLRVTHAYHSPVLRSCVAPLRTRLERLTFRPPTRAVLSSITGTYLEESDLRDLPGLLAAQLVQPFDFGALLAQAAASGISDFVEAGPSSILSGLIESDAGEVACVPLDSRQRPADADRRRVELYLTSVGVPLLPTDASESASPVTAADITAVVSAVTAYPRFAVPQDTPLERIGLVATMRHDVSTRLEETFGPRYGDLRHSIEELASGLSFGQPDPDLGGEAMPRRLRGQVPRGGTAQRPAEPVARSVAPTEPGTPTDATPHEATLTTTDLVTEFITEFAHATGYPADIIEPHLDLEADLGVDSVKRAQVIGTIATRHTIAEDTLDLTGAATINDLAHQLTTTATPQAPVPDDGEMHTVSVKDSAHRYVPRALVRDLAQSPRTPRDLRGRRLLVVAADDEDLTNQTRALLENAGADVLISTVTLPSGEVDHGSLAARLADEHHHHGPRDGIIYLASYGAARDVLGLEPAAFAQAWRAHYALVFAVSQEYFADLSDAGSQAVFAVLTRCGGAFGLKATGGGDALGCLSVGFVKSVAKEIPALHLCLVDVDGDEAAAAAQALVRELAAGSHDDEVSYLGDQRHVIKVVPVAVPAALADREPTSGAIVFSGGSRGIALECALALASSEVNLTRSGRSPVVILGRSRLDDPESQPYLNANDDEFAAAQPEIMASLHRDHPESRPMDLQQRLRRIANNRHLHQTLTRLSAESAPLEYVTCDVSDTAEVARVMAGIRARHGGIRGVVHAAGLESLGLLPKKNYALAEQVVDTKLGGFYNLLRTIDPAELDFLVAFTSISGRFGMDGQTEYTAGAAAVSALCSDLGRRHLSTQIVALDWTAWAEVGMATHHSVQEVQEHQRGLRYLSPSEGCRHFVAELAGGGYDPQVMIFGPLGTNEPRSALDCLTPDREAISHPIDHGSIVDPGTFPLVETANASSTVFSRRLDPRLDTMLVDHLVQGAPTLPGVFHLEAMAEAASLAAHGRDLMIDSAQFENFLKCPSGRVSDLTITVSGEQSDRIETAITADVVSPGGVVLVPGRQRSRAVFVPRHPMPAFSENWEEVLADRALTFDLEEYYAAASATITFGPSFRTMKDAWRTSRGLLAGRFSTSPDTRGLVPEGNARFVTAPLLLDNVGRLALIDVFHRFGDHIVPVSVHQAVIDDLPDDGTDVLGCVEVHPDGTGQYAMRVDVADLHGRPLIHVDRILLHRLNHDAARSRLAHATA